MLTVRANIGRSALRRPLQRQTLRPVRAQRRDITTKPPAKDEDVAAKIPIPQAPLPLWERLGPISTAIRAYTRTHKKSPYITQLCTSVVIYCCGDLSAQAIGGEEYDPWRTVRHVTIGAIASIPVYKWTMNLGNSFNYSSKSLSLLAKIVTNQLVFTPVFNTYFFSMQTLLLGEGLQEAITRVKETVPPSFVNSCKLWPMVTAMNYSFVAPQFRSMVVAVISMGWQTYLSLLNQRAAAEEVRLGLRAAPTRHSRKESQ